MIVLQRQVHNMMFSVSNLVILVLISLVLFKETECGLEIRSLVVPRVVQNGTSASVVLDCDYELDAPGDKVGLVVKWFFRNNPTPVYQWIVGKKPQAFGVFKGRLNLSHRASNEEAEAHRALMILAPTIELTGEYMCLVSNFESEKSAVKNMTVFVKEDKIDLIIDETIDNKTERASKIRVKCEVEGVFPEPDMVLRVDGKVMDAETSKRQNDSTSLFDIEAFAVLDVKSLKSAVTFDCELSMVEADYTAHSFVDYEVNIETTTTELDPTTSTTEYPTSTDAWSTSTDVWSTTTDLIETTTDQSDPEDSEEHKDETRAADGATGLSSPGLPLLLVAISIVNYMATLYDK